MSGSRRLFHDRGWFLCLALLGASGLIGGGASAQAPSPETVAARDPSLLRLAAPVPFRVYQRERDGRGTIPVRLEEGAGDARIIGVRLTAGIDTSPPVEGFPPAVPSLPPGMEIGGVRFDGERLLDVPAGGPYIVTATVRSGDIQAELRTDPVFVGDLWVLAGQSNMEGYGNLIDVASRHPRVMALGMDGSWGRAVEPLHWLVDSPDPVHSGDPATRKERSEEQHRNRPKGAGLGLPFATALVQATGIPVGLIPCAHGGTSMAQWDPARKGDGGASLYGSMLRQVGLAGGHVKGVLWYQGESDANPEAVGAYPKAFAGLIAAVREDFGQPDLPFYYVQIGRFIRAGDPGPWNAVQEAQRKLAEEVPGVAMVSVIDLELDDLIHVGTEGLKRAGERLANVALRENFGQVGATTPTFDRVIKSAPNSLVVKFKGVNLVSDVPPVPPGFPTPTPRALAARVARARGVGGVVGLKPDRRIAGFSIRKEDGTEIPLIYRATLGNARDAVVLDLTGPIPEGASLWYGYGLDPYCNLTDGADMAVPVFGPIPLDPVR